MREDEKDRAEGDFIAFLRWLTGIQTQADLARRTGIPRSDLNRYERGRLRPLPATLRQLTGRIGLPQRLIPFLRWCHQLIREVFPLAPLAPRVEMPPVQPPVPEKARATVLDAVERALALGRAERALPPKPLTGEDDENRLAELCEILSNSPEGKLRLLVQGARSYRDPRLCLRLCRDSERAAANNPTEALRKSELALFLARHVEGTDAFRTRLQGWCTGAIANVQRTIGSDLPGAEKTFARAWHLWRAGEDPTGLLSEGYLLDMEASLRRDQRLFSRALKLHRDALALARPEEVGVILLNQAATLKDSGDPQGALHKMERAAQVIDGERQPRLLFGLLFNQSSSLILLGRAAEAAPVVEEVRTLAARLNNEIDLVKTLWLEGNCAAGQGRKEEALAKFEQVRHEFAVRELPFDYALASLDVVLLYREEGRFPEIRELAGEILEIFIAQNVHREALGAVILLQEAENEQVTLDLVRRLQEYLSKARSNPDLRFAV